jgi:hypothetical protein
VTKRRPAGRRQKGSGRESSLDPHPWRIGLVATLAGGVILVVAAIILRSTEGILPVIVGSMLAVWGIAAVAFGLIEILHLRP